MRNLLERAVALCENEIARIEGRVARFGMAGLIVRIAGPLCVAHEP